MTKVTQKSLLDLLEAIDDDRREILIRIYNDHKDIFHSALGSTFNHQAWEGGYADHIAECLRINEVTYDALSAEMRDLGFSKASAAIALFFHDIEKPFRYGPEGDARCDKWRDVFNQASTQDYDTWEAIKWDIIREMQAEYGFDLTEEEINALEYTHGEGKHHKKDERVAGPLAAHIHHCDNTSARIWHDEGRGLSAPS